MYANLTQLNNELTGCNKSKGRLKRYYRFQTTFLQHSYFCMPTNIRHTTNPAAAKMAAAKPMLEMPAHTVT